jgi:predicted dehydrogenase
LKPRYEVKRAVVFGCGSIGKRHIRNLQTLGIDDIVAFRTREGHTKELDPALKVKEVNDWSDVAAAKPDVAIISNPTSLHLQTISSCLPHVRGIFIEKPLADSLNGVQELLKEIKSRRVVSFVGYNLQFHPLVQALRQFIQREPIGAPLLFQCQVGQWIEDWHPEEDYTQAYFARRDLGGGALLTLIHELHLALQLLGPARRVSAVIPSCDLLKLDVDAVADLMIDHSTGAVSQIHLDMIQRPTHREGVVSCERGWARYNLLTKTLVGQYADQAEPTTIWQQDDYDANASYSEEMKTFLSYVREGRVRHDYDAWKATQSLSTATSAKIAAESTSFVAIPEWVRVLE